MITPERFKTHPTITLVLSVVLIILFVGLWPKAWPRENSVHWLPEKQALLFKQSSIAYLDDFKPLGDKQNVETFTIHISVSSSTLNKAGFKPMLVIHDGSDSHQMAIWQWQASVIAMNGDDYANTKKLPRVTASNVFASDSVSLVTITSGLHGTRLFINGILAKENQDLRLTIPHDGDKIHLVLGNSVYGTHGWQGTIEGFAIYDRPLSSAEVTRHYKSWIRDKNFPHVKAANLLLYYDFSEGSGNRVLDNSGGNQTLQIPSQMIALEKKFLATPWHNFSLSRSFIVDALINFFGFIPLGAVLYGYLRKLHQFPERYVGPATLFLCFILSLGIELSQAWIPTRSSSLLDLFFNTMGAGVGVGLVKIVVRRQKRGDSIQELGVRR